jgi:hypothetical protein
MPQSGVQKLVGDEAPRLAQQGLRRGEGYQIARKHIVYTHPRSKQKREQVQDAEDKENADVDEHQPT